MIPASDPHAVGTIGSRLNLSLQWRYTVRCVCGWDSDEKDSRHGALLSHSKHRLAVQPKQPKSMKRTRMKVRSSKREAAYAGSVTEEGRRAFVERILALRPSCEAGRRIGAHTGLVAVLSTNVDQAARWMHCRQRSVDVHEILARSAGGSIVDEANVLAVCRNCHDWIGNNPKAALALGLRKSRYAGRNP